MHFFFKVTSFKSHLQTPFVGGKKSCLSLFEKALFDFFFLISQNVHISKQFKVNGLEELEGRNTLSIIHLSPGRACYISREACSLWFWSCGRGDLRRC